MGSVGRGESSLRRLPCRWRRATAPPPGAALPPAAPATDRRVAAVRGGRVRAERGGRRHQAGCASQDELRAGWAGWTSWCERSRESIAPFSPSESCEGAGLRSQRGHRTCNRGARAVGCTAQMVTCSSASNRALASVASSRCSMSLIPARSSRCRDTSATPCAPTWGQNSAPYSCFNKVATSVHSGVRLVIKGGLPRAQQSEHRRRAQAASCSQ